MAASYAGPATNLMTMYQQFMGDAQSANALMSFANGSSSLSYAGALNSQA